jgi:hypothetical protein
MYLIMCSDPMDGRSAGQGLTDAQILQMRNTVVEQRKKAILERLVVFSFEGECILQSFIRTFHIISFYTSKV